MSEKLLAYLRQRQEPVRAAELATEVLKLQQVPAGVAARLIESLLAGEARVDRVGEDCYRYRAAGEPPLSARGWMVCGILPERASHWQEWQALACAWVSAGEIRPLATITAGEGADWSGRIARFIHTLLQEAAGQPLVFFGLGHQIALFRRAAAELVQTPLANPVLAMRPLAGKLFPDATLAGAEDLAALLGLPAWSGAEIDATLAQLAAIWQLLIEQLAMRGVTTDAQLAAFLAPEEAAIDWTPYAFDAGFIRSLPAGPGVYLMRDRSDTVIYVGKAGNLARRVRSYFLPGTEPDAKLEQIRRRLFRLEIREVGSELAALLLEQRFIRHFDPEINRQLQVQARPHRRRARYQRILILPSAVPEWLQLFFLDPGHGLTTGWLARDHAQAGPPPCYAAWRESGSDATEAMLLRSRNDLLRRVRAFLPAAGTPGEPEAAEIAWSWLGDQKRAVPGIDLRQSASPAETVRLIEEYRLRLTDWQDQVIFT